MSEKSRTFSFHNETQDVVQYLLHVVLVTFHTRSPGAARTEGSDSQGHIVYVLPSLPHWKLSNF